MVEVRRRKRSELKQPEGGIEDFGAGSRDLGLRLEMKEIANQHTLMII